jgi:hypothetical protein
MLRTAVFWLHTEFASLEKVARPAGHRGTDHVIHGCSIFDSLFDFLNGCRIASLNLSLSKQPKPNSQNIPVRAPRCVVGLYVSPDNPVQNFDFIKAMTAFVV